jgi:flagellar capping protein FliD
MNKTITTTLLIGGSVNTRSASLTAKQTAITNEKALIDLRTAKVKERYLAKFNAMDALLAKMQNTASFLTQQMDALNRASKT